MPAVRLVHCMPANRAPIGPLRLPSGWAPPRCRHRGCKGPLRASCTGGSRLQFILLLTILVVLPGTLLWLNLQARASAAQRVRTDEAQRDLARALTHLERLATPLSASQELCERVMRAWEWGSDPTPLLRNWPADTVTLYLFDATGRRVMQPGFSRENRVVSERFCDLLLGLRRHNDHELTPRERTLIDGFAGNTAVFRQLAGKAGCLLDLSLYGTDRFGGWFSLRRGRRLGGYLLVWIARDRLPAAALAQRAVKRLQKIAPPGWQFGWMDRNTRELARRPRGWFARGRVPAEWSWLLAHDRLRTRFAYRGRYFAHTDLDNLMRLFAVRRIPSQPARERSGPDLVVRAGVILLILVTAMRCTGRSLAWPVRVKLIAVFGTAGLAAVATLGVVADAYRSERERTLVLEHQQRAMQILNRFTSGFWENNARLGQIYNRWVNRLSQGQRSLAGVLHTWPRLRQRNGPYGGFVTDVDGRHLSLLWQTERSRTAKMRKFLTEFTAQEGREILGLTLGKPPAKRIDNILFAALSDPDYHDRIFHGLFRVFVSSTFGEDNSPYHAIVYNPGDKRPRAYFNLLHETATHECSYLRDLLRRLHRATSLRLVVLPRSPDLALPAVPARLARVEAVTDLHDRLRRARAPCHAIERIGKHRVLLSGLPAGSLPDFDLILITPYAPIADELQRLERAGVGLAALLIVFTLMLGGILGQGLVDPVRELERSVGELSALRPGRPLQIDSGDEFAEIAGGVNAIFTDLKEMQIARGVQAQLTPPAPLRVDDYAADGRVLTGGLVSSAMYEHRALADGRLIVYLVEASGGGIRAGLLLGMVRMALHLDVADAGRSPGDLVRRLIARLGSQLSACRRLSVALVTVVRATGAVHAAGFGGAHVRGTDSAAPASPAPGGFWLDDGIDATVLAGDRLWERQGDTLVLTPGRRLVLVGDAVVEARALTGAALGRDGVLRLAGNDGQTADVNTLDDIFAGLAREQRLGTGSDDLALVTLSRHGGAA